MEDFKKQIDPLIWLAHQNHYSVILADVDCYLGELFAHFDAEPGGYNWTHLAHAFLKKALPELENIIDFDPEASMFSAHSNNEEALRRFALAFRNAWDDLETLKAIYAEAENLWD